MFIRWLKGLKIGDMPKDQVPEGDMLIGSDGEHWDLGQGILFQGEGA